MAADQAASTIRELVKWMESKGASPRRETVRKQLFQEGGAFHEQIVDEELVTSTINELVKEVPPLKSNSEKKKERAKAHAERQRE